MAKPSTTIKVHGTGKLLKQLSELGDDARQEAERIVEMTGQKIRTDAATSILTEPKTGRTYEDVFVRINGKVVPIQKRADAKRNLSAVHRASAPGEPPASDTGTLVGSLKWEGNALEGKVFSRLKYAFWLEYGTKYMKERPFMRPAVKKNRRWFINKLKAAIEQSAREFNNK